jgi:ribonuclease D
MDDRRTPSYITTYDELEDFVRRCHGEEVLAVDTEFHSEKTYYPKLCLIQLATESAASIVDPLAIDDLSSLARVFSDEGIVKVFHAANQDIDILNRACGAVPRPVFDTQIAAGLLGHPQQIGYGALVKAFCGVKLPKADSFTDWTRRPLSGTQRSYAIDDVLYLPRIYRKMRARLEETGRLAWLSDDFARLSDPESYRNRPEEAWRRVKRVSSLTRKQLAAAQAVAAWRERTAQQRDIPRKWVLSDEMVIEAARRTPRTRSALLEVRGIGEHLSKQQADELVGDVRAALDRDPDTWPRVSHRAREQREAVGVVDLMQALVHLRARQEGVASQILATKDDLVHLLNGDREESPLMTGWRRRLVGDELCALIDGKLEMRVLDGVLDVRRIAQEGDA